MLFLDVGGKTAEFLVEKLFGKNYENSCEKNCENSCVKTVKTLDPFSFL